MKGVLPIEINNYYACTIPQMMKAGKPETSARISGVLNRLAPELEHLA